MFGAIALLAATASSASAGDDQLSAFKQTCAAATSYSDLTTSLMSHGWIAYSSPAKSRLAKELASVGPIMDAQGLSSDYTVYARDAEGRHLELAISKTRKPTSDGRPLIGCSLYDFAATAPVPAAELDSLANGVSGRTSASGDVQAERWDDTNGPGSGMRAVFVPPSSPQGKVLGFTGMMLGTHFLDGAK